MLRYPSQGAGALGIRRVRVPNKKEAQDMQENDDRSVAPLTLEEANRLAGEIVAEKPTGFRYVNSATANSHCFYAPIGELDATWNEGLYGYKPLGLDTAIRESAFDDPRWTTACLAGEILTRHGFAGHRYKLVIAAALPPYMFADNNVANFLTTLQSRQDNGMTWWEVLVLTRQEYRLPMIDPEPASA